MTTLATLLVKVGVDASGVDQQAQRIGERFRNVGRTLSVTATPAIAALGNAAVNAASDLEESINATEVVFGDAADTIARFGKTSEDTVGLSTRAFNELVTPVGAALQNVGFSADEAAGASINLAQRAADMASVFNTDVGTALEAIQAGLRGEADPLERFGVGLSAAAVRAHALETGLIATDRELNKNEQAQARLSLLMAQTDKIAGDFAATSGSVANQERIAAAEAENMAASFGQQLIPIKQQLISVARQLLGMFNSLSPSMRRTILTVAAVAAAIGPLILVIGSLTRTVLALVPAFRAVGKAFLILSRLLLANPWVLVATAIIALVILIVKNWDKIVSVISAAWNFIKRITVAVWNAVVGFLKRNWKIILAVFTGPIGIIVALVVSNWDRIRNFIIGVMNAVRSGLSRAWNAIRSIVSGAVNAVRSFITSGFNRARRIAVNAVSRLRSGVVRGFNRVVSFMRRLPGRIVGFFRGLPGRLYDVGRNILGGLIDGVVSMFGALGDRIADAASVVTDFWPFSPAKRGPLRRMPPEQAGENIGALLAGGMAGAERDVVMAAEQIARAAAIDPAVSSVGVPDTRGGGVRVSFDFTGVDSKMAEAIRETVRVEGGGDVQETFGT